MIQLPRLVIATLPIALGAIILISCGDGLQITAPTPAPTRIPVLAPTAPAVPTTATTSATAAAEVTPTEAPPTTTATEPPIGVIQPLGSPTVVAAEPTVTPETATALASSAGIEFDPPELVQGGAAVVYFNEPATAATMTFGGMQYPMLFDGARWWAMIGIGAFAEPGDAPVIVAYNPADGAPQTSLSGSIPIVDREFPVENIDLDPATSALLDPAIVNNEEALRATIFSGYTTRRLWDGLFQAPAPSAISSIYGVARSYNGGPVSSYHRGTDFIGATGDSVYAAAAGRVVFADELKVRGNSIVIDHGVGVFTTYNHLSVINVAEGDTVTAGQLIGQLGSTGLVTGPHLHWEVIVRGIEVDGELWLSGSVGQ